MKTRLTKSKWSRNKLESWIKKLPSDEVSLRWFYIFKGDIDLNLDKNFAGTGSNCKHYKQSITSRWVPIRFEIWLNWNMKIVTVITSGDGPCPETFMKRKGKKSFWKNYCTPIMNTTGDLFEPFDFNDLNLLVRNESKNCFPLKYFLWFRVNIKF